MWPFSPKQMTMEYVERQFKKTGLPDGWYKEPCRKTRDHYCDLFAACRQRMFAQHLRTLSRQERKDIQEGNHPSQHHAMSKQAQPYAEKLKLELSHLDWVEGVTLGYYHLDRLVLTVGLRYDPGRETVIKSLPFCFHGFEIKSGPLHQEREDTGIASYQLTVGGLRRHH